MAIFRGGLYAIRWEPTLDKYYSSNDATALNGIAQKDILDITLTLKGLGLCIWFCGALNGAALLWCRDRVCATLTPHRQIVRCQSV